VAVHPGNGDGTFQDGNAQFVENTAAVACADFNGDGMLDVVFSTARGYGSLEVALVSRSLAISEISIGSTTYRVLGVAAGDVDGDGAADVLAASATEFSVFLGRGDGQFETPLILPAAFSPGFVSLADLDGDGRLDIVVAAADRGDTVGVSYGRGDGTFEAPSLLAFDGISSSVAVDDFNGDTIADMAVAYREGHSVSVFLGEGGRAFGEGRIVRTAKEPDLIVTGDFDGDGALDFATASELVGSVWLHFGDSAGAFPRQRAIHVGRSPVSLAAGDVDDDGLTDVMVALAGRSMTVDVIAMIRPDHVPPVASDEDGDGIPDACAAQEAQFVRGDGNVDGRLTISDAVAIAKSVYGLGFHYETIAGCQDVADANDDGQIAVSDAIHVLQHLFVSRGPAMPPPYPACGIDPTDDGHTCKRFGGCER
jgi:hypothetical protein